LFFFFNDRFPSYQNKRVFLAGEGYAGKYIPDLVLRIIAYNSLGDLKINVNGIMIGNGVMDFSDDGLESNQV
jgi:carboxypeptidase C (cathepsin A)